MFDVTTDRNQQRCRPPARFGISISGERRTSPSTQSSGCCGRRWCMVPFDTCHAYAGAAVPFRYAPGRSRSDRLERSGLGSGRDSRTVSGLRLSSSHPGAGPGPDPRRWPGLCLHSSHPRRTTKARGPGDLLPHLRKNAWAGATRAIHPCCRSRAGQSLYSPGSQYPTRPAGVRGRSAPGSAGAHAVQPAGVGAARLGLVYAADGRCDAAARISMCPGFHLSV